MKRLNLRARELAARGLERDDVISLVIDIARHHYRNPDKQEVLQLVEDLVRDPEKYRSHSLFGKAVEMLMGARSSAPKEERLISLEKDKRHYVVFGRELIEQEALVQMDTAMQLPVTLRGALMADAHSGYGLPIGGVLATRNAVLPFGVGMDIGCRMCLSVFDLPPAFIRNNGSRLKQILIENTRFGHEEFTGRMEHEVIDRKEFTEIAFLRELKDKAWQQLGTSGHGNHFVDVGVVRIDKGMEEQGLMPGEYVGILSHSGSRNLGASIAQHYTDVARHKCRLPRGAVNLAWLELSSEEGQEYWKAMELAGDYSAANHQIIHGKLAAALGEKPLSIMANHHNFAWKEKLDDGTPAIVHRKGATPAHLNALAIIPGSMTAPAYLVRGRANAASLCSASHGAGRLMSRSQARSRFSEKTLREMLNRCGVELIGGGTDESPAAYKDINEIMQIQRDLVDITGVFRPGIVRMSRD